jgi:uncharacterized protein (DUF2235 family)
MVPDQEADTQKNDLIAPSPKKRLAVFLDGTWNTVNDNTNVWRLKSLLAPKGKDAIEQLPYYSIGVGTAFGERLRGGMFGHGLNDEIIRAYEWLIDHYNNGDELLLFGFSRGAYSARSLSGLISKCGLLTAGAPLSVNQLYARYRRGGAVPTIRELLEQQEEGRTDFALEERWILKYSQAIDIDFLGVWDTVGALGLPFGNLPILGKADMQFLNTGLRVSNKRAFHALAIDEHRKAFAPTLWTVDFAPGIPAPHHHRTLSQVEQRWFVGTHGNVGGGYENDVLAQAPLKWMLDKASLSGLAFRRDIEIDILPSPAQISDSYAEFLHGAYKLVTAGQAFYREIGADPAPSSGTQLRESINETIDASVFDRWRCDEKYRPPNLSLWAERHNIKLETLTSIIRADNPSTIV